MWNKFKVKQVYVKQVYVKQPFICETNLKVEPKNTFFIDLIYNGYVYSIFLDVFYTFYCFIWVFTMLYKKK